MYQYWGFGLNILSEIEFPELLPTRFEKEDVRISFGGIPETLTALTDSNEYIECFISEKEYYLDVRDNCKYYVKEGSDIYIEPYRNIEGRNVRMFLLATVMAVVVLQRGGIPLHASGIIVNGKAILFTGDSGAGKSTTLAYLASKGYVIFTDDVCVLQADREDEQNIVGIASYPMIKLWDDAVQKLDHEDFSDKSFKVKPDMEKFGYFFHESFNKKPLSIDKIFILRKSDERVAGCRQLTGIAAFQQLDLQVYRRHLIKDKGGRERHFKAISFLSRSAKVFEITRPANGTVAEFAEVLEAYFKLSLEHNEENSC